MFPCTLPALTALPTSMPEHGSSTEAACAIKRLLYAGQHNRYQPSAARCGCACPARGLSCMHRWPQRQQYGPKSSGSASRAVHTWAHLAAEAAEVLGVLANLNLLDLLPQRSTIAGAVLADNPDLFCALRLQGVFGSNSAGAVGGGRAGGRGGGRCSAPHRQRGAASRAAPSPLLDQSCAQRLRQAARESASAKEAGLLPRSSGWMSPAGCLHVLFRSLPVLRTPCAAPARMAPHCCMAPMPSPAPHHFATCCPPPAST